MNEDVLKMIDTLHARLDDVRTAVETLDHEAPEYIVKLDKVDDKLYLLQCEIEKLAVNGKEELTQPSDVRSNEADAVQDIHAVSDETDSAQVQQTINAGDVQQAKGFTDSSKLTEKESSNSKEIFSDDMKENLADAGRAIGNIYRDGKEVITELSGTMGDLKDIFSFGKKR